MNVCDKSAMYWVNGGVGWQASGLDSSGIGACTWSVESKAPSRWHRSYSHHWLGLIPTPSDWGWWRIPHMQITALSHGSVSCSGDIIYRLTTASPTCNKIRNKRTNQLIGICWKSLYGNQQLVIMFAVQLIIVGWYANVNMKITVWDLAK